ncbi:GDP-L-fucose synthase [Bacteroidetes/Chlorobi group bacterium ChocPot_Mid]|jgi:GDP-L-fucose synthase|nr:MAG: GDP-L-fucose synthase [Bacteroidetes/Chlorobi group bacterium ChocPot_Mid]
MNKNDKILIAGYKGLVGSSITDKLNEKGYSNLLLLDKDDIDFRRQNEVEIYFEKNKPDYVFLAAAKVGGILANDTYKAEFIYDNSAIALNVIHSAYKYGVKKLLNLGSSCIYPKNAPQPLKEEYLLTDSLEPTNEPYAIAKILAIKLCRYYNEQYGTNFISVMPTNLFGINDNFNLETSHVLPALIRKTLLARALTNSDYNYIKKDIQRFKLGFGWDEKIDNDESSIVQALESIGINRKHIKVWGSGNVKREFLEASELADACVYLMENYSANEIGEFVNIGTGEDISIKELIFLIKKIIGYKGDIQFDLSKPEGTNQKLLDISRIKSLGWKANSTLEGGIRKVIQSLQL